ncbi:urease accessory protein UreH [Candidatus Gottesmanbacteria bacterium]|nr:urease accessory protein UreH [Candidatus Gottesmanbacteria bacterium]
MNNLGITLVLGLLLGLKHAMEADHVVAVTTLLTEYKNLWKSSLVGMFWGLGHTTILFVIGLVVLMLRINIPKNVSLFFETLVGVMLVILGIRAIVVGSSIHIHKHKHESLEHSHVHSGLHHRSFLIGVVYGIAGSGALMLLVLTSINSIVLGLIYIIVFGIGSIAGMMGMSFVIGLPVYFSMRKFKAIESWIRVGAGILSILLGILLIKETRFGF